MIADALDHWHRHWVHQRNKHELGPTDQDAWVAYINSLTMYEVLEALELHESTARDDRIR